VLTYKQRTLRSSVPSFIQLKRFEKTHIGSISFGAENRLFEPLFEEEVQKATFD
jgi:hypothetical protein